MKKVFLACLMVMSFSVFPSTLQPIVELNPQPTIKATPIGNDKTVALQVIDARPKDFGSANIDSSQNVAQIFTDQISKALTAYGFKLVTTPSSDNQLVVQILTINYGIAKGYFGSNSETSVSMSIQAKNAKGSYTNTYTAGAYSDNYLTPVKQSPKEQVNIAVDQLLTNFASDKGLMQFLAS